MAQEEITRHGVLIVDQSAHMASLIGVMLRSLGRKDIREVSDVGKAMLELKRRSFDVIIIDDARDGIDGVALTSKLRACLDCPNRFAPIIMMSPAPDAKRIAAARDAGVTEFLRKPFAANHLQARLTSIAEHPRVFIETAQYRGPDRRRKTRDVGEERRESRRDGEAV